MQHSQHSASKVSKKLQDKRVFFVLIFIGFLVFFYGAFNYYNARILSFSSVPEAVALASQNLDLPVEIMIPSIKTDLKVDPGTIKDGVWQISDTNATFLVTSVTPGSGGNTVIYGHNKKVIFGNLPYLSVGQTIAVKTRSGKIYNYLVESKYFVDPGRIDLVSPTKNSELTVFTCWGWFDSERVVVKAKPI